VHIECATNDRKIYKERYTDFSLRDIYGIINHMQNSHKSDLTLELSTYDFCYLRVIIFSGKKDEGRK